MENVQFDLLSGNLDVNLGSILENIVAQQLKANGYDLFYFDAKKYGEVDFVVSGGVHTRLIEVKSGNDYHKHSALDKIRCGSEVIGGAGRILHIGDHRLAALTESAHSLAEFLKGGYATAGAVGLEIKVGNVRVSSIS